MRITIANERGKSRRDLYREIYGKKFHYCLATTALANSRTFMRDHGFDVNRLLESYKRGSLTAGLSSPVAFQELAQKIDQSYKMEEEPAISGLVRF